MLSAAKFIHHIQFLRRFFSCKMRNEALFLNVYPKSIPKSKCQPVYNMLQSIPKSMYPSLCFFPSL